MKRKLREFKGVGRNGFWDVLLNSLEFFGVIYDLI